MATKSNSGVGKIGAAELGLVQVLLRENGEIMNGRALAELLKFGSDRSFRRAAAKGRLPVSVFRMDGRTGWFARTREVAEWLRGQERSRAEPQT